MKTYRKATAVILSMITAVLLITTTYSVVQMYQKRNITITYGQPEADTEQNVFPININTATKEELMLITGIGETKAKAIIDYREANGKFETVDDVINVPGIGEKTLEQIREYICV